MLSQVPLAKVLSAVFESIHEGIIVTDNTGKIIFYNSELGKLEALEPLSVIGKHLTEVYDAVTFDTSEHLSVTQSGQPVLEKRKTYFTANGKEITIVASTFPVYDEGKVVAAYSVCRDITKFKELLAKTMQLQDQIGQEQEYVGSNGTRYSFDSMIFASSGMQNLINSAKKAAEADGSLLIFGETGTGKELLVQAIHNYSSRKDEPFVAINCAAIPETLLESILFGTVKGAFTGAVDGKGLFEQAGKGTLFLDELNSMSISLQAKLLRVLQEKSVRRVGGTAEIPVRCRVISSTNVDPWESINTGSLRKDLFYRLAVISLYIPPLREREEDIGALLTYFLHKFQRIYGGKEVRVSSELKEAFLHYSWPGNVRELEHVIESAVNMLDGGQSIRVEHLPPYLKTRFVSQDAALQGNIVQAEGTLAQILRDAEKQVLTEALRAHGGNITKAAESLGIARQNLQYRIRKLGIEQMG
ncbi:MAG: sigma-54 interaction domain-containing protein [Desulfitobacteriaceae bacterium]